MKPFWKSKTVWVNAIAFVAVVVQAATGFVVSPEIQGAVLTAVNLLLRFKTDEAIGA